MKKEVVTIGIEFNMKTGEQKINAVGSKGELVGVLAFLICAIMSETGATLNTIVSRVKKAEAILRESEKIKGYYARSRHTK